MFPGTEEAVMELLTKGESTWGHGTIEERDEFKADVLTGLKEAGQEHLIKKLRLVDATGKDRW